MDKISQAVEYIGKLNLTTQEINILVNQLTQFMLTENNGRGIALAMPNQIDPNALYPGMIVQKMLEAQRHYMIDLMGNIYDYGRPCFSKADAIIDLLFDIKSTVASGLPADALIDVMTDKTARLNDLHSQFLIEAKRIEYQISDGFAQFESEIYDALTDLLASKGHSTAKKNKAREHLIEIVNRRSGGEVRQILDQVAKHLSGAPRDPKVDHLRELVKQMLPDFQDQGGRTSWQNLGAKLTDNLSFKERQGTLVGHDAAALSILRGFTDAAALADYLKHLKPL